VGDCKAQCPHQGFRWRESLRKPSKERRSPREPEDLNPKNAAEVEASLEAISVACCTERRSVSLTFGGLLRPHMDFAGLRRKVLENLSKKSRSPRKILVGMPSAVPAPTSPAAFTPLGVTSTQIKHHLPLSKPPFQVPISTNINIYLISKLPLKPHTGGLAQW
jgi:hypothetical protein